MSIVGLPHQLWSTAKARIMVKELGVVVVKVDRECLDFANMEVSKVKIGKEGPVISWDHLVVSDGKS